MINKPDSTTRQRILKAALRRFAYCGYAGSSVQDIVDEAKVTKPTLYYYFDSKAGLYQALVDWAHDERFRLMQEAAERTGTLSSQLTEILTALFEFLNGHRELMRIAFATAFAAPGEIPPEINYLQKSGRNFEFIHALIKKGLTAGVLDSTLASHDLALAIYGLMNIYVMHSLVRTGTKLNRQTAETIMRVYLHGTAKRNG